MAMHLNSLSFVNAPVRARAPEETLDTTDDPNAIAMPLDALELAGSGAEEMAQLRSMFATRRDFEKKRGELEENFDQVLESDVSEKVEKIVSQIDVGNLSVDELLQYAAGLFPDESDLVLVLSELVRQNKAKEIEDPVLQGALEEAIRRADPRRLKAGINVALKSRLFSARMAATPAALRQCYRQFLENLDLAVSLYQGWISDFGADRRAQVVDFIESALFADMHAHDPSCTRAEFGAVLAALRQLRMLRSSDERFVLSLKAAWGLDDSMSVLVLLTVLQNPYDVRDILYRILGDGLRLASPRNRSIVVQALLSGFKWIPGELFVLDDAREHVLSEISSMADLAYETEVRRVPRRNVG